MSLSLEYIINLPPEKKIDHYCFNSQALLGKGSYSNVFAGFDEHNGDIVAIKTIDKNLLLDDFLFKALQAEIEIMKKLNHANLVRFYNLVTTINNAYVITEYCNGGDLSSLLSYKRRLSEAEAILVMSDVLKGMKELIKNKIIHRDLKPANIFINDGVFKIGDFGFAKQLQNSSDKSLNPIVGTPYYMPPQYLQTGVFTIKHDVWSLGVMFYEILYGEIPWPSNDRNQLIMNIYTRPLQFPRNVEVSSQSKEFIRKCLEISEEKRISWEEVFKSDLFFFVKEKSSFQGKQTFFHDNEVVEIGRRSFEEKKVMNISKEEDFAIFEAENSKKDTNDSFSEEIEKKPLENNEDFMNLNYGRYEENQMEITAFSKNKGFSQNHKKLDSMLSFIEFLANLRTLLEKNTEKKLINSLEKAAFIILKHSAILACFLSEFESKNLLKFNDWSHYKTSSAFSQINQKIQGINDKNLKFFTNFAESPHFQAFTKNDSKFLKIYQCNLLSENREFSLIADFFIVSTIKEINDFLRISIQIGQKSPLNKEEEGFVRILTGLIEYHRILTIILHENENDDTSSYISILKSSDFKRIDKELKEKKLDWSVYLSLKLKVYEINP